MNKLLRCAQLRVRRYWIDVKYSALGDFLMCVQVDIEHAQQERQELLFRRSQITQDLRTLGGS
ncbi:MAG: hypothetical protein K2P84_02780 [Undibacterium sp.]|nr:hypothetical protein [Undibacterium sp.]